MPDFLIPVVQVANGMATGRIKMNNPSVVWEVQQITVVVGPNSTVGKVSIYKNGNLITPTSALTPVITSVGAAAIGQTAAGLPYVYIQASDEITVVATSVTNGDSVNGRAQYREIDSSDPLVRGMYWNSHSSFPR